MSLRICWELKVFRGGEGGGYINIRKMYIRYSPVGYSCTLLAVAKLCKESLGVAWYNQNFLIMFYLAIFHLSICCLLCMWACVCVRGCASVWVCIHTSRVPGRCNYYLLLNTVLQVNTAYYILKVLGKSSRINKRKNKVKRKLFYRNTIQQQQL